MARADDSQPQTTVRERPEREPGRLRAMWAVLLGERLVPLQLQAEWVDYKLIFDDILKRLSAQLARQSKAHKRDLERILEDQVPVVGNPTPTRAAGKAELFHRFQTLQGNGAPRPVLQEHETTPEPDL